MKTRRGTSLYEVLTVVTISSIVLAITVGLLHTLLRTQQTGREHVQRCRDVHRLADAFRRDVHAAVRIEPLDGPGHTGRRLVLGPEGSIAYELRGEQIQRTERAGGKVLGQESFTVPPETAVSIESQPGSGIISLVFSTAQPGRAVRIDALLALDHRFEKSNRP